MLLRLQNMILEMIAKGESLKATAERLCSEVEAQVPGIVCSVLTLDRQRRLHPLAGPSLPATYHEALDGAPIGPAVGSCGTAAFRGRPVVVTSIATDPLWADYRALPLPPDLVACWSTPIAGGDGRVLGTFAFYYRECRGPTDLEELIVQTCVNLCAIAMERDERVLEHERLAFTDALTGLSNRAAFNRALRARPNRAHSPWGVLMLDVDNLKAVNDTFGHAVGDGLIQSVASRLAAVVPDTAPFRVGGDEFAVLIEAPRGSIDLDEAAEAILQQLKEPAQCGGRLVVPTATVGGALAAAEDEPDTIRRNADIALYHAKETCRGSYVRYVPDLRTTITRRIEAVQEVRFALDEGRVDAHYQPLVDLRSGAPCGVEALCRIRRPDGTIVPAAQFCEATADFGIASDLTRRMLSILVQDVRAWRDAGIGVPSISFNVSSADFASGRLADQIIAAFDAAAIPLDRLVLEVRESVFMGQREPVVTAQIRQLRRRGLRVALDDFGTGFASLTHLLTVPVDIIKIDRSFVGRLAPKDGSVAIVDGVLTIARKLGIEVVAEGVETVDQLNQLQALGCGLGQGYLFAMPADRQNVARWFTRPGARIPQTTAA